MGENCRSGCKTKDHASWGDCVRNAGITVTPVDGQAKKIDHELQSYHDARRQGIQPASTRLVDVRAATRASNDVGLAWNAGQDTFSATPLIPKGKTKKEKGNGNAS
jgi:hypothetical protein